MATGDTAGDGTSPEESAGPLRRLWFGWALPFFRQAASKAEGPNPKPQAFFPTGVPGHLAAGLLPDVVAAIPARRILVSCVQGLGV